MKRNLSSSSPCSDSGLDYGSSDGDSNLFCDSGITCDNNNNNNNNHSCWEAGGGECDGGKDMGMDMDIDIDFG